MNLVTRRTTRSITSRDIGATEEFDDYVNTTNKYEEMNVNNHLNTLQLTIITIFSIDNGKRRSRGEKYIVVRNVLGNKFVIKMSDEKHYVSFNDNNNVYQYERYKGSFLNEGQDVDTLDKVLYVCGDNGLCIKDRNDNGPFTLNFISKNNISKETLMIEGAVIAYPLISLAELMTYNNENYHELYSKIFEQTCLLRRNFVDNNLCHLHSLREKVNAINNKFNEIKEHIVCIDRFMESNCERNRCACLKLTHTKYERFCQVVKEANPEIQLIRDVNCKAEPFLSYILDFIRLNEDFGALYEKLCYVSENLSKLK